MQEAPDTVAHAALMLGLEDSGLEFRQDADGTTSAVIGGKTFMLEVRAIPCSGWEGET